MARSSRTRGIALIIGGFLVLLVVGVMLLIPEPAQAQCGASASSCKNCHEVNAKHPVNGSGVWHTKHAFGDFCSFCHGGDVQATDKDASHKGMVYPLADVKTACQSCHPTDANEKADTYAKILGVDLKSQGGGSNGSSSSGTGTGSGGGTAPDTSKIESKPIEPPGEKSATGALIDYNRRYEVEVLGIFDGSRTGNLITAGIGIIFLLLGAVLVWKFEHIGDALRKARAFPPDDWRSQIDNPAFAVHGPVISSYAPPVAPPAPARPQAAAQVELPKGADKLDDQTLDALRRLLADPQHSATIFRAISRLDPALIETLGNLSRTDRALLLAIVEELGDSKP